ncbi:hypothetical protein CWE08_04410 [Aliidiomarina iranensis]|uniref:Uncharacterized protein n=1 Tax=Aliidiomarina iranensis TaxID=1434071 RepID=A0A432W077_9GAMM|nr:hypothetical protein CWE08_04410 [Aliidiomarina iranensis]
MVQVTPTFVASDGKAYATSSKVGAIWSEAKPSEVLLVLEYSSSSSSSDVYRTYESFSVNINGEISTFEVHGGTDLDSGSYNTVSKTIYTKSTAVVTISLDYLHRMVEAEDVRVRFTTNDGYEDGVFHENVSNYGQEMARARIAKFLDLI